jgi:hypothetical protein
LAIEVSCTAFSSPPPPILELQYCLHLTAKTAVALSGGHSAIPYQRTYREEESSEPVFT